jgi:DNA-binding beta-propeller fold protein YncE
MTKHAETQAWQAVATIPSAIFPVFIPALAALLVFIYARLPASQVREPKLILTWGQEGQEPGEFHSPIGIAINKNDEIYVTDLNNARLQKFTSDGAYLGGFELPRDKPERDTSLIGGIALDDEGLIYLSFMVQDTVRVYTQSGQLVREWGKRGVQGGEFISPGGIVLGPDDSVYVADQGNHRVQKFTTEGKFLLAWGEHGSEMGQFGGNEPAGSRFGGPHFLARDRQGRFYTTEGTLGRVQQLSAEGKPLCAWGDKGNHPGGFGALQTGFSKNTFGPIGVLVDRYDRVWISSLNDRVQLFTADGGFLLGIGGSGTQPGQFARPHGMAVDSRGHLYVADAGNQRIQKFEIPEP